MSFRGYFILMLMLMLGWLNPLWADTSVAAYNVKGRSLTENPTKEKARVQAFVHGLLDELPAPPTAAPTQVEEASLSSNASAGRK